MCKLLLDGIIESWESPNELFRLDKNRMSIIKKASGYKLAGPEVKTSRDPRHGNHMHILEDFMLYYCPLAYDS